LLATPARDGRGPATTHGGACFEGVLPLLLAAGVHRFDRVLARVAGEAAWYEKHDHLADHTLAARLREAARRRCPPGALPAPLPTAERDAYGLWHHESVAACEPPAALAAWVGEGHVRWREGTRRTAVAVDAAGRTGARSPALPLTEDGARLAGPAASGWP
jgi:hypothetical protein